MKLSNKNLLFDNIRIASPCNADWEKMKGDDKTRFCQQCQLSVYNISAMTAAESEILLLNRDGSKRVCVRIYRRADGTVLTQDCPVGLRKIRDIGLQMWSRIVAVSLWTFGFITPGQCNNEAPAPQKIKTESTMPMVVPNVTRPPQTDVGQHTMGEPAIVNFGPFAKDLQKRIERSWHEPEGFDKSKPIVVAFKVNKEGAMSDLKVSKSSGSSSIDDAALDAVRHAAPFGKLPADADEPVDIQFTFDETLKTHRN